MEVGGCYNRDGIIIGGPGFGAYTFNLHGEYGLGKNFTVILSTPLVIGLSIEGGVDGVGTVFVEDQTIGLGDWDTPIKYGFWDKS